MNKLQIKNFGYLKKKLSAYMKNTHNGEKRMETDHSQ